MLTAHGGHFYVRGMMRLLAVLPLALWLTTAVAQTPVQIAEEPLDLAALTRIREQGLHHSQVMEYATGLADGIGARLTGSPDFDRAAEWAIAQLKAMGVANPHPEPWGDFGMAWTQTGTSLFLTAPSSATFSAQATPWSPATHGEVSAAVVLVPQLTSEDDFKAWHGKLAGKVILYGILPPADANPATPVFHADQAWLDRVERYSLRDRNVNEDNAEFIRRLRFDETVGHFFAREGAVAILRTRGEAATYVDDNSLTMGWFVFQPAHRQALPSAVVSPDAYGRMARLVQRDVPVNVRLNIQTTFGSEHAKGYNVVAEIPGGDPTLAAQIVLLGGHLDSWAAATGATDDGAGVVVALEAMRILKAAGVHPRRTIRVALWGGEEQGTYGSLGYVNTHLARLDYSSTPGTPPLPPAFMKPISVTPLTDYDNFDVYFNVDNGDGRLLGIKAEGNLQAAQLFRQWAEPVRDLGFVAVALSRSEDTDHASFEAAGLPGFQFIQDPRQDDRTHHTNLDTYERLSEPDLKQAATVLATFAFNAAQQTQRFPR